MTTTENVEPTAADLSTGDTPRLVTRADIAAAAERIRPWLRTTPLVRMLPPSRAGAALLIKPENLQLTNSFKIRGALNAVARVAARDRGVELVAQSSGNHARAVACAARLHGLRLTAVLPDTAPALKVDAIRDLGAELLVVPPAEREATALRLAAERGATLIGSDDPDVIAGHGTVGVEILTEAPDTDVLLVPVCNGGLLAGVAVAAKALAPATAVVGVEPALAADAAESLRRGRRVRWPVELTYRTAADGLRAPVLGPTAWPHIRAYVDDIVTVSEASIAAASTALWAGPRLLAEPSGAVAAAARLFHGDSLPAGKTVAVLSGGNVSHGPSGPAGRAASRRG